MARSVPSESRTNNIVTLYRSGCFARNSNRPLDGLSIKETIEFTALDALPPFDDYGKVAWTFEGEPTTRREKRWLELYMKQEPSWPKGEIAD
jgi:hypothetical protein